MATGPSRGGLLNLSGSVVSTVEKRKLVSPETNTLSTTPTMI